MKKAFKLIGLCTLTLFMVLGCKPTVEYVQVKDTSVATLEIADNSLPEEIFADDTLDLSTVKINLIHEDGSKEKIKNFYIAQSQVIQDGKIPVAVQYGNIGNVFYVTKVNTLTAKDFIQRLGTTVEKITANKSDKIISFSADGKTANIYNLALKGDFNSTNQFPKSLTNADLTGINTSEVTSMAYMFYDCTNLKALNISGFNTSKVTSMGHMFGSNPETIDTPMQLTAIDVSNFDTSKVTDMNRMFYNCQKLESINTSNFDTSNVTNMRCMFHRCSSLTNIDVSKFQTAKVKDMAYMFYGCNKLSSLDISGFNTENVANMTFMFYGCNNLSNLDVSGFNTANTTNMAFMFWKCSKLTVLDVSKFNTEKVTNMQAMFWDCTELTELDVSSFDTSKVTDMSHMFGGYDANMKLTSIKFSNTFDTTNVTTIKAMFQKCVNLTELDLSSFNTAEITDMSYLFSECSKLKKIYVSDSFVTTKVTESDYIFYDNTNLVGAISFNSSKTTLAYANYTTGYFTKK